MRKAVIVFAAAVTIIISGLYLAQHYIGDVRPALLPSPPKNTIDSEYNQVSPSETQTFTNSEVPAISRDQPKSLQVPDGFQIGIFAKNLGAVRDIEFSAEGTLFVSVPSRAVVIALPDKNSDGTADEVKTIITGLKNPHGLAFYQNLLYVAAETEVIRYNWDESMLSATIDRKLFDLPKGGRHFTRTIVFNKSSDMFVSIGSSCDVCVEKHPWLAAVIVSDKDGNNPRLFAKGLRNAVFITTNPETDQLWGTEMGRDFLGDETPPDEINIINQKGPSTGASTELSRMSSGQNPIPDFGWPYCYGDRTPDATFKGEALQGGDSKCSGTQSPVYKIPAHSAPLGLSFIKSAQFPPEWRGDVLVAYHGSWNRSVPTGYKVVRLKVEGNTITGEEDFLTGFLQKDAPTGASGRPVDLIFDSQGSLYVSDDKAGVVYKIVRSQ